MAEDGDAPAEEVPEAAPPVDSDEQGMQNAARGKSDEVGAYELRRTKPETEPPSDYGSKPETVTPPDYGTDNRGHFGFGGVNAADNGMMINEPSEAALGQPGPIQVNLNGAGELNKPKITITGARHERVYPPARCTRESKT